MHLAVLDRAAEPEALGDFQVGRPPQQKLPADDQGRKVLGPHSEPLEQVLHSLVGLDVEVRVRTAVAREELANPQRVPRVARAHQDRVALPVRDEEGAPLQERAQEEIAQLGVRLHHREQRLPPQREHLAILSGARLHHRGVAEDQVHVAGELAGTLDGDRFLAPGQRLHDLDASREDHVEVDPGRADLPEHLVPPDGPALSALRDARDLRVVQLREQPVAISCLGHRGEFLRIAERDHNPAPARRRTESCRSTDCPRLLDV